MTNPTEVSTREFESIVQFLRKHIVDRIKIPEAELTNDADLSGLGVTSLDAVLISGEIEDHYNVEVDPIIMFQYKTINAVAEHLVGILPA